MRATASLLDTPTEELIAAAGELRDRHHGRHLTYSPKVFLPLTNLCRDKCSYCTFRKSPKDPGARTMSYAEVVAWSRQGWEQGCREALMCLGDRPESVYPSHRETLRQLGVTTTPEFVEEACRQALTTGLLPHTNAGLLTKDEMVRLRRVNVSMGLMLENISPRLRSKGMPHAAAPDKDPELRLQMIEEAGQLRIPFTTGILVGIGETPQEQLDSLLAIRDLHARYGHIQEVIVQTFRAKPDVPMREHGEMSDEELARVVAIARLVLGDMTVQAPPNLTPEGHRLLLAAGINDWGGISPVTKDFINPEKPWPHLDGLRATCAEEGFTMAPRLPIYESYLQEPGWLDEGLREAVERARV